MRQTDNIEPGDIEQQLKPGWVPDGWERGDPITFNKGLYQFSFFRFLQVPYTKQDESGPPVCEVAYAFENYRLREFEEWLSWWNYE